MKTLLAERLSGQELLSCNGWAQALAGVEAQGKRQRRAALGAVFARLKPEEIGLFVAATHGTLLPEAEMRQLELNAPIIRAAFARVTHLTEEAVEGRCVEAGGYAELATILLPPPAQPSTLTLLALRNAFQSVLNFTLEPLPVLVSLLETLDPLTLRYILRMLLGDPSPLFDTTAILQALSTATRIEEEALFASYVLTHDLEDTAERAFRGRRPLAQVHCRTGRPYVFMPVTSAIRLNSVLEPTLLPVMVEPDWPGIRVQIHRRHAMVHLYSEKLQDVSRAFPEVTAALERSLGGTDDLILEGVVYQANVSVGQSMAEVQRRIQKLPSRRREVARPTHPLSVAVLELIRQGRQDLMSQPYQVRRQRVRSLVRASEHVLLPPELAVSTLEEATSEVRRLEKLGYAAVLLKSAQASYQPGQAQIYHRVAFSALSCCLVVTGVALRSGGSPARFQLSCRAQGALTHVGDLAASSVEPAEWQALVERVTQERVAYDAEQWLLRPGLVLEVRYHSARTSPRRPSGVALVGIQLLACREDRSQEQIETSARLIQMAEAIEQAAESSTQKALVG